MAAAETSNYAMMTVISSFLPAFWVQIISGEYYTRFEQGSPFRECEG